MQRARGAYTEHTAHIDHISIIRHIETGLVCDMAAEGYGRTQLQEALCARSRYPKDEGTDARSSYFESILPTTAEEGDAALPSLNEPIPHASRRMQHICVSRTCVHLRDC